MSLCTPANERSSSVFCWGTKSSIQVAWLPELTDVLLLRIELHVSEDLTIFESHQESEDSCKNLCERAPLTSATEAGQL